MTIRQWVAISWLVLSASRGLASQQSYCDYRLSTLHAAIAAGMARIPPESTFTHRAFLWRAPEQFVRAYVVATADHRPISGLASVLLDLRARDTTWRRRVHNELRLQEGKDSYWAVLSDSMVAALRREAVPGDTIWAFVTVQGVIPEFLDYWVVTLDEFGTSATLPRWAAILRDCPPRKPGAG